VRSPLGLTVPLIASAVLVTACGGSDDESAGSAAPAPSEFPSADGRTLEEILAEGDSEGPVVSPGGMVLFEGENRYVFGVFDPGGEPIADAHVALYVAQGPDGKAEGPFPARIESLETDPEFTSQTTSQDPDVPSVFYVSDLDFDAEGEWRIVALVREGDSYGASRLPSTIVGKYDGIPQSGDRAPVVHTPTEEDVSDLAEIDTREPHDTMHEQDLADVLGEEPVVLTFATPALCQSRVCGPSVDIAEQVKAQYGDEAAFIHMEIYEDNLLDKGLRPQVQAYGLPTEPWVFVIDRDGRVQSAFEGAISTEELEAAVEEVTG
jgi:hypothetical protein